MKFQNIRGSIRENYNLSHLTWFKVGGKADIFFKPENEDDLINLLRQNNNQLPVNVIGAGSNLIIRDGGVLGIVIKLGQNFTNVEITDNGNLLVGAGCLNFNLAKYALSQNIKNFEFMVGIPGTIGGGVAMNAGSYGSEFKDVLKSVHVVDLSGNKYQIKAEDISFGYRKNSVADGLIFTKAEFKVEEGAADEIQAKMQLINQTRASAQPITAKTGGSTFANPEGHKAWQLIDQAGLRGKAIGDAIISEKHCNFIVNNGNATAADIEELGNLAQSKVEEMTGIKLQWEIKRIGIYERV